MVHSDTSADSFVKNKNICLKPQKAKNTEVIILVYYTLNWLQSPQQSDSLFSAAYI